MKYDFSKIKLFNLEGKEIKNHNVHKTLANKVYELTTKLDHLEILLQVNKGEAVELNEKQVEDLKKFLNHPKLKLVAFVKKAILEFLDNNIKS